MRGIVRPCRSHLGPELHARWQAHLCGLCLTLRDVAGQAERALTGYDVLLLSVLVEAQAGPIETTTAGPCPLRGFTSATVLASTSDASRLSRSGASLAASVGLDPAVVLGAPAASAAAEAVPGSVLEALSDWGGGRLAVRPHGRRGGTAGERRGAGRRRTGLRRPGPPARRPRGPGR